MSRSQRSYSVWHDRQEQWDPNHIDEPTLRCQAESAIEAAEKLANAADFNDVEFIVRDDVDNTYTQIALTRCWSVKHHFGTTLAELSKP